MANISYHEQFALSIDDICYDILLGMGPNLAPVQSCAEDDGGEDDKNTKDYKENISKDVGTKSENTNQHLDQDNLC